MEKLICQNCGNEFENRYSYRKPPKFCNMKCYLESYNRTRETITCKQCKKVFQAPISSNRKFCSQKCEYKHKLGKPLIIVRGNHIKKICVSCGKEFEAYLCRKNQRFCSNECRVNFNSKKIILKCKKCHKDFEVKSYDKNQKYCSLECSYWNKSRIKRKILVLKCLNCNKEFEFYRKSGIYPRRFCSNKCYGELVKGENHHNFNNWSSLEPYGFEFNKRLKERIKKRDNFTCQECGIVIKERRTTTTKNWLVIHHIDYDKKNNSIFNLINLCNQCHVKTNSNRKHWEAYFKMKMFIKEFFNPENIKVFENRKLIAMGKLQ